MAELSRLVPALRDGVSVEPIGTDVLAFDEVTLTRLVGRLAAVGRCVNGQRSVADIAEVVARSTGFSVDGVLNEVVEAVHELVAHRLVELVSVEVRGVRRAENVAWCRDGDRVVLADLSRGERYILDAAGARIWDGLITSQSVPTTIDTLSRSETVAAEVVARDVTAFTRDLLERGLMAAIGPEK